jgi:hypothetical protein
MEGLPCYLVTLSASLRGGWYILGGPTYSLNEQIV